MPHRTTSKMSLRSFWRIVCSCSRRRKSKACARAASCARFWTRFRFRVKPPRKLPALPLWLTTRALWLAAAGAFVLGLGSFSPPFTWIGILGLGMLAIAAMADAVRVAAGKPVAVHRDTGEHFALRRRAVLRYRVSNARSYPLRVTV